MTKSRKWPIIAVLAIALGGCKILPTPAEGDTAAAGGKFDPDAMVAKIWDAKVIPYLEQKAGPFAEVDALARSDAKAAGEKYGNPNKQANSPWTYAVRVDGKIVAANTKSRAASIDVDVDVDGDGKADLRAEIGPAMRGTALRDVLDFVNFNEFINQIDFAQYGKAFNTYADKTVLSKLPRENLEGHNVRLLGAYVPANGSDLPLLTPAKAEIGPSP
ncbi:DUF2291 family protein [Pseudaminobacter sp. 19-2017]|uniref:DUF2291 family protein n=1 Tax=Pseudaminobacter soli (ex Zhang et al. 2022) TaxID=2831468 RepID=A0A942I1E2_9HYPH|nr:DUF2291 family protein [Pseudaminobacter soli]MBS3647807.1 DUF2291 family protein [Pseudaminobacter soli]